MHQIVPMLLLFRYTLIMCIVQPVRYIVEIEEIIKIYNLIWETCINAAYMLEVVRNKTHISPGKTTCMLTGRYL